MGKKGQVYCGGPKDHFSSPEHMRRKTAEGHIHTFGKSRIEKISSAFGEIANRQEIT